ncbi:PREDICTED: translin-associated protein X isoform X1 [Rhagoletis zephyria]|uniref:translin-associated protein X isoform X1 n=1 Tax=Rhagoletis zephyria TaxID=28612 RepID=UPI0008119AB0|nr:PREDICTED: translin-associated protein X isoform X1 [Rhagoletis zephyria]
MSQRSRNSNRRNQLKHKYAQNSQTTDEQNPVIIAFQDYALELDDKHDRYERIVKLSRDITIEAKRIIFLLHTIDGRKNNRSRILDEAEERLEKVVATNFKSVALELNGQDPYQYRCAYSPGLQEFIEAYSFMEYFKHSGDETPTTVSDWSILQQKMQFAHQDEASQKDDGLGKELEVSLGQEKPVGKIAASQGVNFVVDPTEFILGIADLTGELMRRCINSLGSGETNVCLESCKVLQQFFTGYISLNIQRCRELSRKIYTMRQSVIKAENVCYNVKVRGGEAAKWGSVLENKVNEDLDEGFY